MRFLRIEEVMTRVGLSRPTIWRMERANDFPRRRQLGRNSVAWVEEEIEEWMASREVAGTHSEPSDPEPRAA